MTMPSGMAIIGLVIMSKIMAGTGQTEVLANGIAGVLGKVYVIFSPFIGLLGSFMTGSNMSSNILFAGSSRQRRIFWTFILLLFLGRSHRAHRSEARLAKQYRSWYDNS